MGTDIRVGGCIVRPQRRLIERSDESVHITPRAMSVLENLVAAQGAPVSRSELFDRVWRGAEVSDDALTKCIGELRRAFGDSARESRVIETIPKLGMRLIPPVEPLEPESVEAAPPGLVQPDVAPPAADRARAAGLLMAAVLVIGVLLSFASTRSWLTDTGVNLFIRTASILSPHGLERAPAIAVLPFLNLSSDTDNDYFSDGMSTEIINALARTRRLPVIARSSSFQFKGANQDAREIGRRLGVTHVLEGSVRKAGGRIRLTAQLIDTSSGELVWSEVYQRELVDIFKLQHEIATDIVDQVYLALGYENASLQGELVTNGLWTARPTDNLEAYDLYLKGVAMMTSDRPVLIEQAPGYFDRAIALDGDYADAWAAKGYALAMLGSATSGSSHIPASVYPGAIAAFRRALEIEPGHASATGWLGVVLMINDFKWAQGLQMMEQALARNPNDAELLSAYGFYLDTMHLEGAGEVLERAYRLDPFSIESIVNLAVHLSRKGRLLEAAALVETSLIEGRDGYAANYFSAGFNLGIGRLDAAEEQVRRARRVAKPVDLNLDALQWLIDSRRGKGPLPRAEIWERMQTEKLSGAVLFDEWEDEQSVVAVFDLAIKQRIPALRSALFGTKPPMMPEADWHRFREITGVAQFEQSLGR